VEIAPPSFKHLRMKNEWLDLLLNALKLHLKVLNFQNQKTNFPKKSSHASWGGIPPWIIWGGDLSPPIPPLAKIWLAETLHVFYVKCLGASLALAPSFWRSWICPGLCRVFSAGMKIVFDKNRENSFWQCFWRLFNKVFELYAYLRHLGVILLHFEMD
jgi:hypothetical protein